MDGFEEAFSAACEEALKEMLGKGAFASTVYHLSRNGVSLPDGAKRPADFEDALSVVFNPVGASLVEGKVLKSFYRKYGEDGFMWGDGLNFCEEVRRARQMFEANGHRRLP
ncbi:MAG: hypothetical protein JRN45_00450 [Nitrososphaerota archaeon]|nr:hypothetical protein [Nitrososphaerota archaeon]